MELKPGYKQTEVGLIPEDWDVKRLGEVARFRTGPFGSALHKEDYTENGIPIVNPMHIVDAAIVPTREMTITAQRANELNDFRLRQGDIVIGRRGEMGRCAVVAAAQDGWLCGTGSMIVRANQGYFAEFLQLILSSKPVIASIENASVGSTMINLNQGVLNGLKVALPSNTEEQQAIATSIKAVGSKVEALQSLITKKRQLKQAAMQELLTGKRRLPGFEGKWAVKRLGEVAHIKTGSRNNEDKSEDGEYPFFVRSDNVERIGSYSYDCEAVLVPGEGRIGEIFHYINGRFDVHQRVYAITQFTQEASGKFVHFYMAMKFGSWAMQNTVKATVDSLRLPTFQTFEMLVPPTKEEQDAIARVLAEIDTELAALEARKDKAQMLKQGMMQQLLTGKIRLI
jgi:type I restriction enzyme S subunit